jgi:hypothetical protein
MPVSAVYGAPLDPKILEIDKSYYANEVRLFASEGEALKWLREQ